MQLAIPRLRSSSALRSFNRSLQNLRCDLNEWRMRERLPASQTAALDADNGAGWDLAQALLRPRKLEVCPLFLMLTAVLAWELYHVLFLPVNLVCLILHSGLVFCSYKNAGTAFGKSCLHLSNSKYFLVPTEECTSYTRYILHFRFLGASIFLQLFLTV